MQSALLRSAGSLRWRTEYELRRRPIGCGVRHGGLAWHSAAWQSRHGMWHATYEMQHAIYICTHSHKQNIARKMILPQERERLDEEKVQLPSSIFEATPLGESQHLKALLSSRKCRIIAALILLLIVGVIVAVVLVTTQNGNGSSEQSEPQSLSAFAVCSSS